jgi:hypothetical protein
MELFIQQYGGDVTGTLSGFDRLVFRGSLRRLAYQQGMMAYLWAMGVLLKDFAAHVTSVTFHLKEASLALARKTFRPIKYLSSSKTSKEHEARKIASRDGITKGLICVLTCIEPCNSYEVHRSRDKKKLELICRFQKCLHIYHYYIHPVFGFMNARIQTWFPFSIQICINGREWLSKKMDEAGIAYIRKENCFTWIEDTQKAQDLMDTQLNAQWPTLLRNISRLLNPIHDQMFKEFPVDYYWSVHQSEWASDIMFKSPDALARLYPTLVHHGITTFKSPDVMRFLGRKIPSQVNVPVAFTGEVVSDLKQRPEGIRIKHRVKQNSIKLYDKQGSVLRPETTINDPKDFKVYRLKEGDKNGHRTWLPMRKGIADLYRRAQVSHAANNRYLDALASTNNTTPLKTLIESLCKPVMWKGKRVRALNPHSHEDSSLLESISRGEFLINGFRNRDLRIFLYSPDGNESLKEKRRQSSAITRKIRLLRAHGLVKKVPRTHRYQLTDYGRNVITALIAAQNADTNSLTKLAA